MQINELPKAAPKAGTKSTEFLDELVNQYLERLKTGQCPADDQPTAAAVIEERLRLYANTENALQASLRFAWDENAKANILVFKATSPRISDGHIT